MKSEFAHIYKEFPVAVEYVSSIYLIARDYGYVTNVKLANWTGVSKSAVSQALGRLKRLGLGLPSCALFLRGVPRLSRKHSHFAAQSI